MCAEQGLTVGAEELDHIVPVKTDANVHSFFDESNWQGLCRSCHEFKTADENRSHPMSQQTADWQEHMKQWD